MKILFSKMGNEIINENEEKDQDKEPQDYQNDFIRYGVISKKCGEKSLEDNYLLQPNLEVQDTPKQDSFSLFGVFDGHNSDYISKYLSDNIQKLYEKEIGKINKDNYKRIIEDIFKTMDKELREKEKKKKESKKEKISETKEQDNNENKIIENENEENISDADVGIDEKEINKIKEAIKNSKEIPDDSKEIDDDEIKNLILFANLFKYNNNYLYSDNDMNFIGSSASVVLISDNSVITADLGTTKAILFSKDGNIINSKDNRNHTFNNLEEKKRIKKFHKNIDYQNLKLNFYVPASRSFGFFKFKDEQILKEENQIISCVPDVCIYDRNNVDFILLITRGGFPVGDSFKKLFEKIKNISELQNIKLTELINEYISNKKEETEKIKNKNINNASTQTNKTTPKSFNSIYVGKEDFGEENLIISELNNTYYKDILSLNNNDCNGDYNTTCILIQLLKNIKPNITPTPTPTPDGNTKIEEKNENENSQKVTNSENKNEIKDDNKNKIKNQNDETKIKEEIKKEENKKE